MTHRIDPTVDCVFKALLGAEENKNLLIHFLNAVLEPTSAIQDVAILNPYNEREFITDKLTIVDVKAMDENAMQYQIEIQLDVHPALAGRILFTWSSLYHSQLGKGDDYDKLTPIISIWILNGTLFPDTSAYHLDFAVYNARHNLRLNDHLAIHLLQLPKWRFTGKINSEKERWIYLFREGKNTDLDNPPTIFNTKEMRQAMETLQRFSENQKNYLLYQSRLEAILEANTMRKYIDKAKKEIEQAKQAQLDAQHKIQEAEKKAEKKVAQIEQIKRDSEAKTNALLKFLQQQGISLPDEFKMT